MSKWKKKQEDESEHASVSTAEAPVVPATASPPPEAPPAPVAPYVPAKYKVKKTKKASYYGQEITLHEGEILDESGYTKVGIERLIEAGVELEKV
jgi:energy-converting hydrogenase Eha subunit F